MAKPSSETTLLNGASVQGEGWAMAIQTQREWATRLRQKAADCENLAKDLPQHRVRLLGMAEHYWQLADKIDQPRGRPGSLTETFTLARSICHQLVRNLKQHPGIPSPNSDRRPGHATGLPNTIHSHPELP
jgi:hypothetical protein